MNRNHCPFLVAALWIAAGTSIAGELSESIAAVRAVGPHGEGHVPAAEAWRRLAEASPADLPQLLAAMDGANPLAANWLRAAVDTVAERAARGNEELPADRLKQFVLQRDHAPRARRLAYELLAGLVPEVEQQLLPAMLDDPSLELRRDAVARVIDEAENALKAEDRDRAAQAYRRAVSAARDEDQIRLVSQALRNLGEEVDLQKLMGFVVHWKLIGPFDNTDRKGFATAYPPERELDFAASYDGKHGQVAWIDHGTEDDHGKVDLNKALVEEKSVVGYAAAEFFVEQAQTVQFRLTSLNAVRLWVNGQPVIDRHIYHSGSSLDQYVGEARLRAGGNIILVKICQNEQTQSWAKPWAFQFRVCDGVGTPVSSSQ